LQKTHSLTWQEIQPRNQGSNSGCSSCIASEMPSHENE